MTAGSSALGYRITVPNGWQRITVGEGSEKSIAAFVESQLYRLSGTQRVLTQRDLTAKLTELVGEAESSGALDFYVFQRELRGIDVSMHFVISVVYLGPDAATWDDHELIELMGGSHAESEFIDFGNGRVLRVVERLQRSFAEVKSSLSEVLKVPDALPEPVESGNALYDSAVAEVHAAEAENRPVKTTRVTYLVPSPAEDGVFLLLSLNSPESSFSNAEIIHFDAVASTLVWV